jgi:limonene-1,2-epoxide hydrolase
MQYSNNNPYDEQGYDSPSLPYVPYASGEERREVRAEPGAEASPPGSDDPTYVVPVMPPSADASSPYTSPSFYGQNPPDSIVSPAPPRKRRRVLWISLGAIVAFLIVASLAAFGIELYINRPTPSKTLDAFCNDLQREDYQSAYNQFSKNFQTHFSEVDFANVLSQDKVVSCLHGTVGESGNSVTTTLKLIHDSQGVNNDMVTLRKDASNNWKIDDLEKA